MSIGLECLAGYPACLSLGPLEGKGSFGIATPEIILFNFRICSFWVKGFTEGAKMTAADIRFTLLPHNWICWVNYPTAPNKAPRTSMCFKTSDNEIVNFDCRNGIP